MKLEVPYDPSASGPADGVTLAWWSKDTSSWQPVPTTYDASSGVLVARIAHFSVWSWVKKTLLGYSDAKPSCDGPAPGWAHVSATARGEFMGIAASCAGHTSEGELQVRVQSDHDGFSYVIFRHKPARLFLHGAQLASTRVREGWYALLPPGVVLEADFSRPTAPPARVLLNAYAGRDGLTYAGDALLKALDFVGGSAPTIVGKALLGCYSSVTQTLDSQLPSDEESALDCARSLIGSGVSAAEKAGVRGAITVVFNKALFWTNVAFAARDLTGAVLVSGALPTVVDATLVASQPTSVSSARIAAGGNHTCALLSRGTVECWGYNLFGQLGAETETDSSTTVEVRGISGATQIAAGGDHTCALLSGGSVECWGENEEGVPGEGLGGVANSIPVEVRGISGATQIAVGGRHTCALLSGGTVECWGANDSGQLGNETDIDSSTPVEVQGISGATEITAGGDHTCALLSGGTVECWGENQSGQLGDGNGGFDEIDRSTPVEVQGISSATQVVAGGSHTCALLSDRTVECWGSNGDDQLGDGNGATDRSGSFTPVEVQGIAGATEIAAGKGDTGPTDEAADSGSHTCALLSNHTVECWGFNGAGQLGDGTDTSSSTPVSVKGILGATEIAAGGLHTCALLSNGAIRCWGDNNYGQLGDGRTGYSSSTPVSVKGIS